MPGPRRFPLPLIAAFFALYVIWGSTYLVIRIGVEYWPPLLLAGFRFCTAGALMYGFLRWRGVPAPTWPQWKAAGMIGILLLTVGNGGVSVAEHMGVSSGVAALAVAMGGGSGRTRVAQAPVVGVSDALERWLA